MNKQQLFARLDPKIKEIAEAAIEKPGMIAYLFEGLEEENTKIKTGCANIIIQISRKQPEILYPYFDDFVILLDNDDHFVKRSAIIAIALMAKVDQENNIEKVLARYCEEVKGPNIASAQYSIRGLGEIAKAKPTLSKEVTRQLLKIQEIKYQTAGCKDTAFGFMITAFDLFFEHVENKKEVIELIEKLTKNKRNATKGKAEKFFKKWSEN